MQAASETMLAEDVDPPPEESQQDQDDTFPADQPPTRSQETAGQNAHADQQVDAVERRWREAQSSHGAGQSQDAKKIKQIAADKVP